MTEPGRTSSARCTKSSNAAVAVGNGGTFQTTSSRGTEADPAGGEDADVRCLSQEPADGVADVAGEVLTVVDDDERLARASSAARYDSMSRAPVPGMPTLATKVSARRTGSLIGTRSTNHRPSAKRSRRRAATSMARRVLRAPPKLDSVTRRTVDNRVVISAISSLATDERRQRAREVAVGRRRRLGGRASPASSRCSSRRLTGRLDAELTEAATDIAVHPQRICDPACSLERRHQEAGHRFVQWVLVEEHTEVAHHVGRPTLGEAGLGQGPPRRT